MITLDADDLIFDLLILFLYQLDVLSVLVDRLFHNLGVLLDVRQLQLHLHLNHLVEAPSSVPSSLCATIIPGKRTSWLGLRGVQRDMIYGREVEGGVVQLRVVVFVV
jgi:hypothetical protein